MRCSGEEKLKEALKLCQKTEWERLPSLKERGTTHTFSRSFERDMDLLLEVHRRRRRRRKQFAAMRSCAAILAIAVIGLTAYHRFCPEPDLSSREVYASASAGREAGVAVTAAGVLEDSTTRETEAAEQTTAAGAEPAEMIDQKGKSASGILEAEVQAAIQANSYVTYQVSREEDKQTERLHVILSNVSGHDMVYGSQFILYRLPDLFEFRQNVLSPSRPWHLETLEEILTHSVVESSAEVPVQFGKASLAANYVGAEESVDFYMYSSGDASLSRGVYLLRARIGVDTQETGNRLDGVNYEDGWSGALYMIFVVR